MMLAFAALLFNLFVLPRLGGRVIARSAEGRDTGIVLYPLVVLVLVVTFRDSLHIAASAWMILAVGDGMATLAGMTMGGRKLPWNSEKSVAGSLAFVAFGTLAALGAWLFVGADRITYFSPFVIVASAVFVAAIVESLPLNVDDNLTIPVASAFVLFALQHSAPAELLPGVRELMWVALNLSLALVGFAVRSVDWSGALGGAVLGSILILCGGIPAYVALLVFFVIGSAATRLGYRRKLQAGLAQEKGGRRSFAHAFSNVGVSVLLVLLAAYSDLPSSLLILAAIASLATAAADTTASEVGQWIGKRTFMPLSFRSVPPGTEGAISLEGTIAGGLAALITAAAGVAMLRSESTAVNFLQSVLLITLSAMIGSWIESLAGSWNRQRVAQVPNGALNFFNTALGAALFLALGAVATFFSS